MKLQRYCPDSLVGDISPRSSWQECASLSFAEALRLVGSDRVTSVQRSSACSTPRTVRTTVPSQSPGSASQLFVGHFVSGDLSALDLAYIASMTFAASVTDVSLAKMQDAGGVALRRSLIAELN